MTNHHRSFLFLIRRTGARRGDTVLPALLLAAFLVLGSTSQAESVAQRARSARMLSALPIGDTPREWNRLGTASRHFQAKPAAVAARSAGRRLSATTGAGVSLGEAAADSWLSYLTTKATESEKRNDGFFLQARQQRELAAANAAETRQPTSSQPVTDSSLAESDDDISHCPQDARLDASFALCTALDNHKNVKSYTDLGGHSNEYGAYSRHNQIYDATGKGKWYIEEQYYGFLFIQAGLAFNNSDAIRVGMKIYNWGFDQLEADGSFGCPDVYHSAGFFLESAARAALLLRQSPIGNQPKYQRWIRKAVTHVAAMAAWFVRPDIERIGWRNDAIHTHRRFLTGTALGMAGILTDNHNLIHRSIKYIRSGLELQDPSGFNYERHGHDCSYQGIGLVYAARYYLYVAPHIQESEMSDEEQVESVEIQSEVRSRLLEFGRRGAAWLVTRVGADGALNATGNTRTGSAQEVGRNGKPKALARKDVFHALLYWSWVLGDPKAHLAAWRVEGERTRRVRASRCDCNGGLAWGLEKRENGSGESQGGESQAM
ncbi:hypothetical protein CLOP_g19684 [Closterium sp. NIES-67]|nr:hypothetical protein CLOP_g19684 [Closterium sp. NIES-67]